MTSFCKFLEHGLVYNNNTTEFVVSPCCYFSESYAIDPTGDLVMQFNNAKKKWLSADYSETCKTCIKQEAMKTHSYRQAAEDLVNENQGIVALTIAVNKKCNLACATCDDSKSSFWFKQNQINHVDIPAATINLHREDKIGEVTEKFLSLLAAHDLSNLKYIKFGGGEPFMSDIHHEVLQLIPDPKNVTVQYTSNFSTKPSNRTLSLWENFKLIKWVASIDGVGEQFEFLRWPYRWENLISFKEKMWEMVPANVMFGCEHTLSPLNVLYYDRFESWFSDQFAFNRLGDPTDFNLHFAWGILGIEFTNEKLRDMVKSKYGASHPVTALLEHTQPNHNCEPMLQYLDKLSRWRKMDWRTVFPEVHRCYQ